MSPRALTGEDVEKVARATKGIRLMGVTVVDSEARAPTRGIRGIVRW